MGAFAVYTFSAGIYLVAGYLVYRWLLASLKQPAFNRAFLLLLCLLAFALPLLGFYHSRASSAALFGIESAVAATAGAVTCSPYIISHLASS